MSGTRRPTHAGSWYTSNGSQLQRELEHNLSRVTPLPDLTYDSPVHNAKAILAPHAGYSYSGPAAAWAYAAIPSEKIKRVVLLGPSHHAYIPGIALSRFEAYGTPLGSISLDLTAIDKLRRTRLFLDMKPDVDEDEHSLEMHLPYIRHVFTGRDDLRLVPLLVGHVDAKTASKIHEALVQYWSDPETFFIISTDFCHWGTRFSHTPYYPHAPHPPHPVPPVPQITQPAALVPPDLVKRFAKAEKETPIWKSIQYMDHEGMELLREPAGEGAVEKWLAYLDRTKNTICGRNPITILLGLVSHVYGSKEEKPQIVFVRYEQSSKCETGKDSSVSYVSGVLRLPA